MADREKVIKEFELFIRGFHPACTSEGVELDMFREVLALLKEPEAVEPKITTLPKKDHDDSHIYRCGNCDMIIFKSHKYCPFCGQAVKWE